MKKVLGYSLELNVEVNSLRNILEADMNFDSQSTNQTEGLREDTPITDSMILDIIMKNSQDTIYFKDRNSRFIANSYAHLVRPRRK